jgi:hypothetical protein
MQSPQEDLMVPRGFVFSRTELIDRVFEIRQSNTRERRTSTMKYEAPKIAVVFCAVKCIENNEKGPSHVVDAAFVSTIGAYQADE